MMGGVDTRDMTLYEYQATLAAWSRAHSEPKPPEISADEMAELEAEAGAIDWDAMVEVGG